MSGGRPLRVTAVSLPALPAIDPAADGPVGGTEVRAWTLCRGLATLPDTGVTLLVRGPANGERTVEGVRVRTLRDRWFDWYVRVGRAVERTPRFPFLRVRSWDAGTLWRLPLVAAHRLVAGPPSGERLGRVLRENPADVFLVFGVTATSAAVVDAAAATGRSAVVGVGCDDDLDARYATDPAFVSPYGDRAADCLKALTESAAVLVQTDTQAEMLRDRFGREGVVLPNPIDRSVWRPEVPPRPPAGVEPGYALWVGRAEGVHKRPQLLPDLARLCPGVRFLMVLNPADAALERRVRAAVPPNVTIVPRLPPPEMPGVFAAARCLVNTSAVEGFPNVFLQAAAVGVPVQSLLVLGDWLAETGVGRAYGGDLSAMAAGVSAAPPETDAADAVLVRHELRRVAGRLREALASAAAARTAR